ncbi:Casein kinase 1-like protein 9 [Hypsizygus marmoreus]|uniref:Casein kinase 1-like protein 9 n=1 Tax=Hypsizygus marmoreus TaxID=39966 RepID=A0A369J7M3_HYPMA|nr:Casein kinase 1-like protein 9 [Hypsizygus marmoreus]
MSLPTKTTTTTTNSEDDDDEDDEEEEEEVPKPLPPIPRYLGNWFLSHCLGSGYSGSIFQAQHVHTGQIVALKVQYKDHECPTNKYERYLYPLLRGGKGMPTLWAEGVQDVWDYMAIDLLGASLDSLYRKWGGPLVSLDVGSVCCIAMQVISRLELMHARGVLHRDIQLGNVTIGRAPQEALLYMIDFGFSKQYIDPKTRRHIPDSREKRDFIGNYWFSSVNVHCRGRVPSRRDDLEAVALMLIHLLTPRGLSWTRNGIPKDDEAHEQLKQEKRNARPQDLCRGLPDEFEEFLRYCRRLKFQDQPDYGMWIEEFRALKVDEGYGASDAFIWPPPPRPQRTGAVRQARKPVATGENMEGVLNGLANLNLNHVAARPVLGDLKNLETGHKLLAGSKGNSVGKKVIDLTSDSDSGKAPLQQVFSVPKARRLVLLTERASKATNNAALSGLVREFIEVMQCNSSRALTKDGSRFLDVLHKQLADPSVFVTPMRTSRQASDIQNTEAKEPTWIKLGVVARLKNEVLGARSNQAMAAMVADFGKVTNKSTGRTITKDGFGFLEGLAARLTVLE